MDSVVILTLASSLVAALFGILIAILGWMGNKLYNKLDEMARSMHLIEKDLHGQINNLHIRMVRVEDHIGIKE